jgi:S-adenosylmethionine:tRNA ribosyltransferase-isomerase
MIAAGVPEQRPADAKLLLVDRAGHLTHWPRRDLGRLFQPGDLVIANDAATMPASLVGRHVPSGRRIEARLAGRDTLAVDRVTSFMAVLFGLGDFRMRTEDRPSPPPAAPGDRLELGPLRATVVRHLHDHPRLVALAFTGTPAAIWEGLARHGRPIQYAHVPQPLVLWDTWTPIATVPVAFEPPSAGFALDWRALAAMRARGTRFATITHAAGLSSTGDPELDAWLPFDEPYHIPERTAFELRQARADGRRVVAVGTTVVRAIEHAAGRDGIVHGGDGLATQRIGPSTALRVVDAVLSGTHERGSSHYELLRAFADDVTLDRVGPELEARGYRTHEFGDSVLFWRQEDTRIAPIRPVRGEGQRVTARRSEPAIDPQPLSAAPR